MIAQVELEVTREISTSEQMWRFRTAIRDLLPQYFDSLQFQVVNAVGAEVGASSELVELEAAA